jgi:polyisoprenoid-binding protein YceI
MKKVILTAALFTLTSVNAFAKTHNVDVKNSVLNWTGTKVTGKHHGRVWLKSGKVEIDKADIKGGEFVMDMSSIKVDDIKDPEYNGKLTGHLKSDDFFGVTNHPTSTFKITSVRPLNKDGYTHEITGNLTIKNITKPVSFPAKVLVKGDKATAKGKLVVDRTDFDVKYGSGKFFENMGDKMIHDNFEIELDLKTI